MPNTSTNFWFTNGALAVTVRGGNPVLYYGDLKNRKINVSIVGTPALTPFSRRDMEGPVKEVLEAAPGKSTETSSKEPPKVNKPQNYTFIITIDTDQYKVKWQDLVLGDPNVKQEEIGDATTAYLSFIRYFNGINDDQLKKSNEILLKTIEQTGLPSTLSSIDKNTAQTAELLASRQPSVAPAAAPAAGIPTEQKA